MQPHVYLKEGGFPQWTESNSQSILAFGWLEVLPNGLCLNYFYTAANHDIILVRKLFGIYFLESGYV